jgi:hypothetical protein
MYSKLAMDDRIVLPSVDGPIAAFTPCATKLLHGFDDVKPCGPRWRMTGMGRERWWHHSSGLSLGDME